jgi:uncharacterized RDD family membrane protein YckC
VADYAGVGSRIVAIIIDSVILCVIMAVIALPLGLQAAMFSMMDVSNVANTAALLGGFATLGLLMIVINLGYYTYFEGTTGQTLGKKLVNIKVAREDGKPMTYADALIRTLLRIIDGIMAYLIGFIVILATEKKQRIGDIAAHTIVVKA